MTILYPHGSAPWASLPAEFDASTSPLFIRIFENPDARVVFLVEAYPWSASAPETHFGPPLPPGTSPHLAMLSFDTFDGETAIRMGSESWRTRPDDPVLPDGAFPGRISERGFAISARLFEGLDPTSGGGSSGSEIEALFDIADESERELLERWSNFGWDGRRLTIKAGLPWFGYADFGTVAAWTVSGLSIARNTARILPRDRGEVFARDLQQNLYAGTGGAEGHSALAGLPKPLGFGRVHNASPVLTDQANWIYQLHDGEIDAVTAVRDRGVALTPGSDYPSHAALASASIAGGSFATCLAEGFIRLGAEPAGGVTADFKGDAAGGYTETAGGIIRRIVTSRLGARSLNDPEDIAAPSFAALDDEWPAPCGLYLTDQTPVQEVLSSLTRSFYGSWFLTRTGKLAVKRFVRPSTGQYEANEARIDARSGIEMEARAAPPWRIRVGYGRNYTIQGGGDLAGAAEAVAGALELYGSEYRFETAALPEVRTRHRLAETLEWPTQLAEAADAAALAAHMADFSARPLMRRRVSVLSSLLRFWIGDAVILRGAAPGLEAGLACMVAAIAEDFGRGTVELEVVG